MCNCGANIGIPRLSELRLSAGQTRYPNNAVARVNGMLKRGELPTSQQCMNCSCTGTEVKFIGIQCEKASSEDPKDNALLAFAIFGWIAALAPAIIPSNSRAEEIHGRETRLEVPLRFCKACINDITPSTRKRDLRKYLATEPAYAELLNESPDASLEIFDPINHQGQAPRPASTP